MMNRRVALLLLWVVFLISVSGAWAQTGSHSASTTIKGTVLGADGKPVATAAVECQSAAGLRPRVVHTDAKGHYLFTGLKQDAYDIRATSNGAYSDWEKNIPLRKGQNKEITLHLLNGNTTLSGMLPEQPKN
jgi:Carboxypeptidase regulatory-like domain